MIAGNDQLLPKIEDTPQNEKEPADLRLEEIAAQHLNDIKNDPLPVLNQDEIIINQDSFESFDYLPDEQNPILTDE